MATYLLLASYTEKGKAYISLFPGQDEVARQFQAKGLELKACYLLLGQYDLAAILEAPDEFAVAKVVAEISSQGLITTETLRAFTPEEVRRISLKP